MKVVPSLCGVNTSRGNTRSFSTIPMPPGEDQPGTRDHTRTRLPSADTTSSILTIRSHYAAFPKFNFVLELGTLLKPESGRGAPEQKIPVLVRPAHRSSVRLARGTLGPSRTVRVLWESQSPELAPEFVAQLRRIGDKLSSEWCEPYITAPLSEMPNKKTRKSETRSPSPMRVPKDVEDECIHQLRRIGDKQNFRQKLLNFITKLFSLVT
ncbi:phorbol-12-myristate-13-acetate-induced protein 1 isoform X2 [Cricetulus griseus]|uniref:Phorbol-12-myristate-13-acetate-induced protein 1 isoform X2 n=1 Tax=Cricetulus griseus TaxID=10029 RepID=A0A9J7FIQ7_CRIGR|nr:phorbol-12-myristate-13-acetate-induced protein 1 isoform X2 [Cricetulus griseus]